MILIWPGDIIIGFGLGNIYGDILLVDFLRIRTQDTLQGEEWLFVLRKVFQVALYGPCCAQTRITFRHFPIVSTKQFDCLVENAAKFRAIAGAVI